MERTSKQRIKIRIFEHLGGILIKGNLAHALKSS